MVQVKDTGCGIPKENLPVIFEPFFSTKGDQGTGIGLWVIKGIVTKLGGRIEVVTSTVGETGTTFSVFLPATKPAYAGGAAPDQPLRAAAGDSKSQVC